MLYYLNCDVIEMLKTWAGQEENDYLLLQYDAVQPAICLGLIDVTYVYEKKRTTAKLHFSNELISMLACLDEKTCTRTWNMVDKIDHDLMNMMNFYGLLPSNKAYELYRKYVDKKGKVSRQIFTRVLNVHDSMLHELERFRIERKDGTSAYYVSLSGLDHPEIIETIENINLLYGNRNNYAPYNLESDDLQDLQECQKKLAEILKGFVPQGAEKETAENISRYIKAGHGYADNMRPMMFLTQNQRNFKPIDIWLKYMTLELKTPMPIYNGYSRLQFEEKY